MFAQLSGETKLTVQTEVWKSTPEVDAALDGMEEAGTKAWIARPRTWDK